MNQGWDLSTTQENERWEFSNWDLVGRGKPQWAWSGLCPTFIALTDGTGKERDCWSSDLKKRQLKRVHVKRSSNYQLKGKYVNNWGGNSWRTIQHKNCSNSSLSFLIADHIVRCCNKMCFNFKKKKTISTFLKNNLREVQSTENVVENVLQSRVPIKNQLTDNKAHSKRDCDSTLSQANLNP